MKNMKQGKTYECKALANLDKNPVILNPEGPTAQSFLLPLHSGAMAASYGEEVRRRPMVDKKLGRSSGCVWVFMDLS